MITSRSNAIAKQVRALRQRKEREATGLFLVEGIKHVGEAVEAWEAGIQTYPVEFLCYAPELLTSDWARGLIQEQIEKGRPCHAFSREVFESLADKENPQGLLAVVRRRPPALEDLAPRNFAWGVALVQPQDPGNIGTILRTVDAVDAGGLLLLDGSADPTHPGAVRASMGAIFWRPVAQASFASFTRWASQHGYHLVGTSAHGSVDYRSVEEYQRPLVLLLGSERAGLSNEQAAACSQVVRLPMHGRVTSLNLAVAAGVMMYDIYAKSKGDRG
jgi:TrmH family RNA methyltransferase